MVAVLMMLESTVATADKGSQDLTARKVRPVCLCYIFTLRVLFAVVCEELILSDADPGLDFGGI